MIQRWTVLILSAVILWGCNDETGKFENAEMGTTTDPGDDSNRDVTSTDTITDIVNVDDTGAPADTDATPENTDTSTPLDTDDWIGDDDGIHVATWGDDNGDGSMDNPYQTISKAAEVAVPGDRVVIHEGIYRETVSPANSGTAEQQIVFKNYHNDHVVISAMAQSGNWTLDSGQVYKTTVEMTLGDENMVLLDGTLIDLARWPNKTTTDPFALDALYCTDGSTEDVISDAWLAHPDIPDWDWENGGVVFFYGKAGWTSWRERITASAAGRVTFDLDVSPEWLRTAHAPSEGGEFYLMGIRQALDHEREWYYDDTSNVLYVQIPGGGMPADGAVEIRQRTECLNLNNRSYITVKGLHFVGGTINVTGNGATNNRLEDITSTYGNHGLGIRTGFTTQTQSIMMEGSNNTLLRSNIGYGTGTGVYVKGDGNRLENNHIHDFDYIGDYDAPVNLRGGKNTVVTRNSIYNGGRDCIQLFNENTEISYNDISRSNLVADDCGLLYTVGRGQPSEIHHNWFHDTYAREGQFNHYKAAAIYLDNDGSYFRVYRNVIWNIGWSAIQQNWDCWDNDIFNNTMWNIERGVMDAWHKDGTAFDDVQVWNNLSNSDAWEPQSDRQNNLTTTVDPFVDAASGDFRLRAGTEPIDYGREIVDYTNDFVGAAPDAGAYEHGDHWVAGADWTP